VGAALSVWHQYLDNPRSVAAAASDAMMGSYLGPSYGPDAIRTMLDEAGAVYRELPEGEMIELTAGELAKGNVVGWFQGRMEFGPRALGGRSILGDPHSPEMQKRMNLKIKFRESFRPFAPAVVRERVADYFELDADSPYMLLVAPVDRSRHLNGGRNGSSHFQGLDKLKAERSTIPAVTHVDMSARVQTVERRNNPRFYDLITAFGEITGDPVVINTSFNVRGEPIVCTPEDAFRCFMRTGMDYLVIENFILAKSEQTAAEVPDNDDRNELYPAD
jgi:carbamoyltransferase